MSHTSSSRAEWAAGGVIFGATMMVIIGAFQVLEGIAAVVRDQFYVVSNNYLYEFNTTGWGWVHIGIGAAILLTGLALFTGSTMARWVGIFLVGLSAVANFFYVPYYPLWAILIIAVDVFVIWALASYRAPTEQPLPPGYGQAAGGASQYGTSGMATSGAGRWQTNPEYGAEAEGTRQRASDISRPPAEQAPTAQPGAAPPGTGEPAEPRRPQQ